MAQLDHITAQERASTLSYAIEMAQTAVGIGQGLVSPNARVGSLSAYEWEKIAMGAMSGWVAERSRQVSGDRLYEEECLLATGEVPEPYELGLAANLLPALGDLVEKMGLSGKPVGDWRRDEICLFVWTAAQMFAAARARNDERPEPAADTPDYLMAG